MRAGLRRRHRLGRRQAALFERIDAEIAPMRERYEALMAQAGRDRGDPARRRARGCARARHAAAGASCARRSACATCRAVGRRRRSAKRRKPRCRRSSSTARPTASSTSSWSTATACCCRASASTRRKDAGQLIARLKREGGAALRADAGAPASCTWASEAGSALLHDGARAGRGGRGAGAVRPSREVLTPGRARCDQPCAARCTRLAASPLRDRCAACHVRGQAAR